MSLISGNPDAVTGAALTPQQQLAASRLGTSSSISAGETAQESADAALLGTSGSSSTGETPQEQADAALLDVTTGGSSSVAADLAANVPPDLTAASALVSDLAGQIGQPGSQASSVYSLLTADATLKLTRS